MTEAEKIKLKEAYKLMKEVLDANPSESLLTNALNEYENCLAYLYIGID